MSSSARKTSRRPRRGTRRKRYGRRLHRKDVVIEHLEELLVQAKAENARLVARRVGLWARLRQWWSGLQGIRGLN